MSELNHHDEKILLAFELNKWKGGMYKAITISFETRDEERQYEVKWKRKDRQDLRSKLNKRLLFILSRQAASHKWC